MSRVKGSWAGRGSDDGSDVEGGIGSEGGGTSRPATNITGASWTNNSGGYEFMLRSWSSEEMRSRTLERHPTFEYFKFHTTVTQLRQICSTTTVERVSFLFWNLLSMVW